MRTSIATVSISGDLVEKLGAIAAAGFDGVEIFETDLLTSGESPSTIGRMARDLGLEITLFQPFRDFEGLPEPLRARAFERARRKFALMNELGTDLILICSNVSPAALGGIDRAAADLRDLGEIAEGFGVRVGYEALAWGRHVSDHRDAWEVVRRADHNRVGLILDSFHTLARRIDPDTIRAIPGDRIFIVQLADAPLIDMDLLYWSRHFRNMPGEGDLAVVPFMQAVAATGYAGPLSLEIFNDQFRGGSSRAIAADGHRSLVYLMDQVARKEPHSALSVPAMPDRIAVKGVEFIEFAADARSAPDLEARLKAMGFAKVGRHRTKSVVLYRQGGINIVVNTEDDGLAHATYVTHGTSAYAIGLKVEDAAATVARARALGAQPFEQAVGEGELRIPAIRGVGGGVIHFLDDRSELARVWDVEFVPISGVEPVAPVGLERVDHIAQTMNHDEMLTWVLFYRSIFAMEKSALVDVPDPSGLVRSLAVESPSGSLRLTLNGAENSRTLAGHFVTRTFGSSVQHLAFATSDIFAAVAAMGLPTLPIGQSYYDDVEARLGLDPDFVARLRAHNILYDRDESGEFLQAYSHTMGEGFFFEIVERRGGYRGYGAPNAPFRIAAQKRALSAAMP
ncbi:4-hydroxyphenylpyruvate dioxygenase [Devosia enhydra]|uniref:3-dehydroshikimate dehydratase n=1 Tax=Devosia enhydra TaxID=665118 RepID=A0A1K2HYE4_9HYPH|nr:sugar phosphate isomerase/epimerase and 4-hydroxyphenylpyruvate domain-containing protein [Devosia enhydra]SFZ84713.1 4-hydroxyphenylpyruvate dioxygenase [Devosia enhydra]